MKRRNQRNQQIKHKRKRFSGAEQTATKDEAERDKAARKGNGGGGARTENKGAKIPNGGDKWEWQTINVIGQIMLHKLSNAKRHYQKGAPHKVGRNPNAKRAAADVARCK